MLIGYALACAALLLLLPSAAAQFQRPNCMSGVPCGQFCAPVGGSCMRGACFDASGMQVQCYAAMAPMAGGPGMFGFPPFVMFQPFAPMQPMPQMVPMVPGCGGRGPCAANEFCDPTGVCRPDDCVSQFTFGCPADKGTLQKVPCPHFSGFNRCYASTSGGFSCNKGPSGGSVACASKDGGSSSATMSGSYQGPNGAGSSGFVASSSSYTAGPAAQQPVQPVQGQGPMTTTGPSTPVISAVGGGAAAGSGVPSAAANKAAAVTTATSKAANGATPTFITEGSTRQTYVSPDGTTVTAFGNGPPGISMTNIAPDGSSMASGSAMGDQQSVTTTTIPGGSSVTSTSSSNGPAAAGPAGASASAGAVASSSSSSGSSSDGAGAGGQPLYTPFQTVAPGNTATAQFVDGMSGTGAPRSSDAAAAAAASKPPSSGSARLSAPAWMAGAAAAGLAVALWL
ncbi:hypothetical protein OEZ85_004857 [Tetradesmus obliquus]|uniref:Uncharacterized protein n=1 Tax=Tetradesmus obliquus TaxID=3088 RepID=A0ABY8UJI8_TETOB|nr:hypothetical protein OEZ85_004857 [Tetradesmus obliquus]